MADIDGSLTGGEPYTIPTDLLEGEEWCGRIKLPFACLICLAFHVLIETDIRRQEEASCGIIAVNRKREKENRTMTKILFVCHGSV